MQVGAVGTTDLVDTIMASRSFAMISNLAFSMEVGCNCLYGFSGPGT